MKWKGGLGGVILFVVSRHVSGFMTLSFVCHQLVLSMFLVYVWIYLTDVVFVYRSVIEATSSVLQ